MEEEIKSREKREVNTAFTLHIYKTQRRRGKKGKRTITARLFLPLRSKRVGEGVHSERKEKGGRAPLLLTSTEVKEASSSIRE